jgi:hypothetical protein
MVKENTRLERAFLNKQKGPLFRERPLSFKGKPPFKGDLPEDFLQPARNNLAKRAGNKT